MPNGHTPPKTELLTRTTATHFKLTKVPRNVSNAVDLERHFSLQVVLSSEENKYYIFYVGSYYNHSTNTWDWGPEEEDYKEWKRQHYLDLLTALTTAEDLLPTLHIQGKTLEQCLDMD